MLVINFFHYIGWIISNAIGRVFFRLEVKGQENIENLEKGGAIFIANHYGKFDPFLIGASIPRPYFKKIKCFRYLTHYSYIIEMWYGPFIWLTGAYSVFPSKGNYEKSLKYTTELLKDNQSILMFPTGSRMKEVDPREARPGIAYLAKKLDPTIVPIFIKNTYKVSFIDFILKRRLAKVIIGKPFRYSDINNKIDNLREAAKEIMGKVKELENK